MRYFFILSLLLFPSFIAFSQTPQAIPIFPPQEKHVHASSLVETPQGDIIAAWFYGSGERTANDVRIQGARLRKGASQWSTVFEMADTPNFPDCNPVLFIDQQQRLWLFWTLVLANRWENSLIKFLRADTYDKEGPPEWNWQDVLLMRIDESFPNQLAAGFKKLSPPSEMWAEYARPYSELLIDAAKDPLKRQLGWMTRNHPHILASGRIVLPLYSDGFNVCLMALSDDSGNSWQPSLPIVGLGPIQPTLAQRNDGRIIAYFRDSGDLPKRVQRAESQDNGVTWTVTRDIDIPNPSSSLEVLVLADGRWLLVGNDLPKGRYRLGLFLSEDEGETWHIAHYIDQDETNSNSYAYPSMIQASDGTIHVTYSCHTKQGNTIKHFTTIPEALKPLVSTPPEQPEEMKELQVSDPIEQPIPQPPSQEIAPSLGNPEVVTDLPKLDLSAGDPDASKILDVSAKILAASRSLAFDFHAHFAYTRKTTSQESTMSGQILLGPGNLARFQVKRADSDTITYNSGTDCIAYSPAQKRYTRLPAAGTRRNVVATITQGTLQPILDWLGSMMEGVLPSVDEMALEKVDCNGTVCWNITMETPQYTLNATFPSGEQPLPTELILNFKEPLITQFRFPQDASLNIKVSLSNWQLNPVVSESDFVFTPPADAKEGTMEDLSSRPKIEAGAPAPDFTLEQLGGGTVQLKNLIGKGIIVLEFWATTCTVCQKAIPEVKELLSQFSGQEIIFYTINQRETPERIQSFLKERNIDSIPILLDTKKEVGNLYQVTGIPKMVIIGKDGLIKSVITGMPADFNERFTGIIKNLVEGKPGVDTGSSAPSASAKPATVIEGTPAINFTLDRLEGGKVNLGDHFGQHVVVLEFWRTTCGYCRRATPVIVETMKEYADKDIVLYAINLREEPEKIQTFLQEQGLELPVLLDPTGNIGTQYEVVGIPKVVMIGKDGLIKAIVQGMSGDYKGKLIEALDKALRE